jgi:23S rRNA G2445 N2-methylase RlmL
VISGRPSHVIYASFTVTETVDFHVSDIITFFRCKHVVAVDIDPQKIGCAQHNATVYGVNDHIDFIVGDFIHIAPHLKVFLIP